MEDIYSDWAGLALESGRSQRLWEKRGRRRRLPRERAEQRRLERTRQPAQQPGQEISNRQSLGQGCGAGASFIALSVIIKILNFYDPKIFGVIVLI